MSTTLATLDHEIDHELRLKAGKNPAALAEYRGRLKERADEITRKSDQDLKQYATRAANERDVEKLWRLTEAYIITRGKKKAKTSLATLDTYRVGIERLLKHWEGENLLRPSRNAANRYIGDLQVGKHGDRPLEPGTIQVRIAAAKALYRALRDAGATELAPFADASAPDDPTPPEEKRVAYEDHVVDELVYAADDLGAVIVLLGADAGLRASEMLALRWNDVAWSSRRITVRAGKGGRRRKPRASHALIEALETWKTVKESSATEKRPGYVMPFGTTAAIRLRVNALCELAGVEYHGVHSLRHSCGTYLADQGEGGLRDAQRQLGHSSITTTEIYAKMKDESLAKAMDRRRRVLRRKPREQGVQPPA